jgi:hypothetical protein
VKATDEVARIKAIVVKDGIAAGRVAAQNAARLEGEAKRAAVKAKAKVLPAMPVNDWIASEEYQQLRSGILPKGMRGTNIVSAPNTNAVKAAVKKGNKEMATAKKQAKKGGALNTHCPLCGYKFNTPKAKCSSAEACKRRQAEAKGGKKAAPAAKAAAKKAPAAKKAAAKKDPHFRPVPKAAKKTVAAKRRAPAKRVTKRVAKRAA